MSLPAFALEDMPPKARIGVALAEMDNRHELLGQTMTPVKGSDFAAELEIESNEASYIRAFGYAAAAREHLTAAQALWADSQFRDHAVSSLSTLLRTVLLSYARVVWLVSPDDPRLRIARSCHLHIEELSRQIEVSEDLLDFPEMIGSMRDGAMKDLRGEIDRQRKRREKIKRRHRLYAPLGNVTDTAKIRFAADLVANGEDADLTRSGLLAAWRHSSGHAHGLSWARARNVAELERTGPHWEGIVIPDYEEVSLLAVGAALIGQRCMDMMSARRIGPRGSAFGIGSR